MFSKPELNINPNPSELPLQSLAVFSSTAGNEYSVLDKAQIPLGWSHLYTT